MFQWHKYASHPSSPISHPLILNPHSSNCSNRQNPSDYQRYRKASRDLLVSDKIARVCTYSELLSFTSRLLAGVSLNERPSIHLSIRPRSLFRSWLVQTTIMNPVEREWMWTMDGRTISNIMHDGTCFGSSSIERVGFRWSIWPSFAEAPSWKWILLLANNNKNEEDKKMDRDFKCLLIRCLKMAWTGNGEFLDGWIEWQILYWGR